MASPAEMVESIRTALAANPVGVVSITVDGQTVTYSRAQALDELRFWQREDARESGARRRVRPINLGGF